MVDTYAGDLLNVYNFGVPYLKDGQELAQSTTQAFGQVNQTNFAGLSPTVLGSYPSWQWIYRQLYIIALWSKSVGGIFPPVPTNATAAAGAGVVTWIG